MTAEASGKLEFPKFMKVVTYALDGRGDTNLTGGKQKYIKVKARLNPMHISSFREGMIEIDDDPTTITIVSVMGNYFYLDMPISEFDKLMESTQRGFEMEFVENRQNQY